MSTPEYISGFQLPEGSKVTDLYYWADFAEWFADQYGYEPMPEDTNAKEILEAWIAGAYWEFRKQNDL